MNSVHESGSRTMSKNLTQEKYRVKSSQKQAECTECPALGQPARPLAPRAPAPAACAPRALQLPTRPAPRALPAAAPVCAPCAVRLLRPPERLLRPPARLLRPVCPAHCHNTKFCIVSAARPLCRTPELCAPTRPLAPRASAPAACTPRALQRPTRPAPRALPAVARLPARPAPRALPAVARLLRAPALLLRAPALLLRAPALLLRPACPAHCHNTKFFIVTQPPNQSPAIQPRNYQTILQHSFPAVQSLMQYNI